MDLFSQKKEDILEPIVTDFPNAQKGVKFNKEVLVEELLSLGNAKITQPIAQLIGDEVEKEILKRHIEFLSSELISELVESKLADLRLIKRRETPVQTEPQSNVAPLRSGEFTPEILEILSPGTREKPVANLKEVAKKITLSLSDGGLEVLRKYFLVKNEKGEVVETPEELFSRVARSIASADIKYSPTQNFIELETQFYNLMASKDFIPSPAILKQAGRALSYLSNCCVLPIQDNMESIFESMKQTAIVQKSGGNTGLNFSKLRPRNDSVQSTSAFSSGPVSFMKVYNSAVEAVKEGKTNGGEMNAYLDINHPDVIDFLSFKNGPATLPHFHLTLGIPSDFMRAAESDSLYSLINPRSREMVRKVKAKRLLKKISENLFNECEPDIVFTDRFQTHNPLTRLGEMEGIDPCSGQALFAYEACYWGTINLANMADDKNIFWEKLKKTIHQAIHFLDNVIEVSHSPMADVDAISKKNRKISLGIMGFSELLIELGLPYASQEAEGLASHLMNFFQTEAQAASIELAQKRGPFANYSESLYADRGVKRRHATVTAIFPNQLLADIGGVTAGIEPLACLATTINLSQEAGMTRLHPLLEKELKKKNYVSDEILTQIIEHKSLSSVADIPQSLQKLFLTTSEITPDWHLKMQAAFQKQCEGRVVKKIVVGSDATDDDISRLILLAYHQGAFGVKISRPSLNNLIQLKSDNSENEENVILRQPKARPDVMTGVTKKIKTPCGELFLTLNEGGEGLFEIFAQLEKSGKCSSSQLEAIGRLVSLALRSGIEAKTIAEVLTGIHCGEHHPQGTQALSFSDAIAKSLLEKA